MPSSFGGTVLLSTKTLLLGGASRGLMLLCLGIRKLLPRLIFFHDDRGIFLGWLLIWLWLRIAKDECSFDGLQAEHVLLCYSTCPGSQTGRAQSAHFCR
jgi:hypothetical protein